MNENRLNELSDYWMKRMILKNKPQINADERRFNESVSIEKDCLGMSTYREAICVVWESRTVRFRHDERRFNEWD
ncbi:MAG: hypothetical protein WA102_04370 [Candidatus Methanoperedens sp.]